LILAVDVQYKANVGYVAGVSFNDWTDDVPANVYASIVDDVGDYVSGQFYKRELPCILGLLKEHQLEPDTIVVDGYVFLDGDTRPGLGKYLYDALTETQVIGVAKKPFSEIKTMHEILRGKSNNPLYVTSVGQEFPIAKSHIESMYGEFRIPALLKLADKQCRQLCNQA